MKRLYAALRFAEDRNISDRVYWYITDFPLKAGEKVLAPVGTHDRLQRAVVERVLLAEDGEAPYDPRLIKRVEAKHGARKLCAGGKEILELGGVPYDEKHYTRYRRVLLARELPRDMSELFAYGVTKVLEGGDLHAEIAHSNGCVLLAGEEGERAAKCLLSLARGETEGEELGLTEEEISFLKEKLR